MGVWVWDFQSQLLVELTQKTQGDVCTAWKGIVTGMKRGKWKKLWGSLVFGHFQKETVMGNRIPQICWILRPLIVPSNYLWGCLNVAPTFDPLEVFRGSFRYSSSIMVEVWDQNATYCHDLGIQP